MNFSVKDLERKTKKELIAIIHNLSEERDQYFDDLANSREELKDAKVQEEDLKSIEIAKDIIGRIKDAKYKLELGVAGKDEEILELNYKLEELFV